MSGPPVPPVSTRSKQTNETQERARQDEKRCRRHKKIVEIGKHENKEEKRRPDTGESRHLAKGQFSFVDETTKLLFPPETTNTWNRPKLLLFQSEATSASLRSHGHKSRPADIKERSRLLTSDTMAGIFRPDNGPKGVGNHFIST